MKAIHQLNSNWTPGKEGIPAKLYKAAGQEVTDVLQDILSCIWEQKNVPEDFWDALIIVLYKNKGSKAHCRNYRGISLLSITRKILAHIILNWLITMSEAKCRLHPRHSMVNIIFSVRQVQEKCILYSLTWPRPLIQSTERPSGPHWHDMAAHGNSSRSSGSSMLAWQDKSSQMAISPILLRFPKEVNQGCILAPILFNLLFTCVLNYAVQGLATTFDASIIHSFINSQPSQRHWLISSGQHCLPMTVHSWHTSPVTCKPCWTGCQMPQNYLAWPLALENSGFFFNQHPTEAPLSPLSSLMAHSWRPSRASSTLEAWSQMMDNSTKKSLWRSARQAKFFEDSATGCAHTKMCPWPQVWKSTELLSSHHCSTAVSPGFLLPSHQAAGEVPYVSTLFHNGYMIAGQNHQSLSPRPSQINLHQSNAAESSAQLVWPHHPDGQGVHAKEAGLWWTSTRTKKTRPAMKVLQAFQTQHTSLGPPPPVCTHTYSKCITGKKW